MRKAIGMYQFVIPAFDIYRWHRDARNSGYRIHQRRRAGATGGDQAETVNAPAPDPPPGRCCATALHQHTHKVFLSRVQLCHSRSRAARWGLAAA